MPLGDRIKQRREELGLSQRELAQQAGVPQPTISDLERGRQKDVTTTYARRLARALGVTADYLIGMYDNESEGDLEPAALATACPA